jgi:ABC-type multidrug transport system fused ATPase/permease subunit
MYVMPAQQKRIPRTPDTPIAFIRYVLRHCSAGMKGRALAACVSGGLATAADTLVPWVMGRIVGAIIGSHGQLWPALSRELLLLAGLWTLRNVFLRTAEYFERHYVPELLNTTRELLFNRLLQQSQFFLHGNFAGVLANHVRRAGDIISSLRDKMQWSIGR